MTSHLIYSFPKSICLFTVLRVLISAGLSGGKGRGIFNSKYSGTNQTEGTLCQAKDYVEGAGLGNNQIIYL